MGWAADLIRWLVFDRIGTMVFWGVMSCITSIVAACGPSRLARICAIYLMFGWAVSNLLHFEVPYISRREGFTYLDVAGSATMVIVFLRYPYRWLGVVIASTFAQLFLHFWVIGYAPPAQRWTFDLINNLLYGLQLVATSTPTFGRYRLERPAKRRRPRRGAPAQLRIVE